MKAPLQSSEKIMEKKESSFMVGKNKNWCSYSQKVTWNILKKKKKKMNTPDDFTTPPIIWNMVNGLDILLYR